MTVDIQFAYPQQVIQVSKVVLIPDSDPPTLSVTGVDFSAVDEVRLNDVTSPLVVILSKTSLTAVVPKAVQNAGLMTVTVVSYNTAYTDKSVVSFQCGKSNRTLSGVGRLVQLFLKVLLTTPGSDIFSPSCGGGCFQILGRTFSKEAAGGVVADFVIAVDNTVRQILSMQSKSSRIPPDERLLSARVTTARFDASSTALVVSVCINSQAGTTATTNVVL